MNTITLSLSFLFLFSATLRADTSADILFKVQELTEQNQQIKKTSPPANWPVGQFKEYLKNEVEENYVGFSRFLSNTLNKEKANQVGQDSGLWQDLFRLGDWQAINLIFHQVQGHVPSEKMYEILAKEVDRTLTLAGDQGERLQKLFQYFQSFNRQDPANAQLKEKIKSWMRVLENKAPELNHLLEIDANLFAGQILQESAHGDLKNWVQLGQFDSFVLSKIYLRLIEDNDRSFMNDLVVLLNKERQNEKQDPDQFGPSILILGMIHNSYLKPAFTHEAMKLALSSSDPWVQHAFLMVLMHPELLKKADFQDKIHRLSRDTLLPNSVRLLLLLALNAYNKTSPYVEELRALLRSLQLELPGLKRKIKDYLYGHSQGAIKLETFLSLNLFGMNEEDFEMSMGEEAELSEAGLPLACVPETSAVSVQIESSLVAQVMDPPYVYLMMLEEERVKLDELAQNFAKLAKKNFPMMERDMDDLQSMVGRMAMLQSTYLLKKDHELTREERLKYVQDKSELWDQIHSKQNELYQGLQRSVERKNPLRQQGMEYLFKLNVNGTLWIGPFHQAKKPALRVYE